MMGSQYEISIRKGEKMIKELIEDAVQDMLCVDNAVKDIRECGVDKFCEIFKEELELQLTIHKARAKNNASG